MLRLLILACLLACAAARGGAEVATERPEWATFFADAGTTGTIVVREERGGASQTWSCNAQRAVTRFSPASTFKIPHALFALEAGAVRDEFHVFPWDGERRWLEAWNRDQDLRSSMRNSVVWVYEGFAREIGPEREAEYLRRADYGNADISSGLTTFWIGGSLRISAYEQVGFLRALHRNALPFRIEHQRLVKDIIVVEAGRDWILRAKTGWSGTTGWWVGWVERPEGAVYFALNIDVPNGMADMPKREAIGRAVLRSIGALPGEG